MSRSYQPIHTLRNLLDYEIRRFMNAETQLQVSLPLWIEAARSVKLKSVLFRYWDITQEHISRIQRCIEKEHMSSHSVTNQMVQSFIKEMGEKLDLCSDNEIKDACIISGIQAISHYKISMYGTAAAFANALGLEDQATVFYELEVNEKQIDGRLSQLAEFEINKNARGPFVFIE